MFYEIRRYQVMPGRRDEWVRYMEGTIIPYMTECGMSITASFIDEEHEDAYIWMRRFEDEQDRIAQYAAVHESERWINEIFPVVSELLRLDKIVVTRVVPTPQSALH